MKTIVQATNIDLTPAMQKYVEDKINAIEKFYPKIIEARVEVEYDPNVSKGDNYRCEVNLSVPGKLIRVEKRTTDMKKAVNKVKDHLKVILSKERKKKIDKKRGR